MDNTSTGSLQNSPPPDDPLPADIPLSTSLKPAWMLEYEQMGMLPPIPIPDPEIVQPHFSFSNSESSARMTPESVDCLIFNDSPPST